MADPQSSTRNLVPAFLEHVARGEDEREAWRHASERCLEQELPLGVPRSWSLSETPSEATLSLEGIAMALGGLFVLFEGPTVFGAERTVDEHGRCLVWAHAHGEQSMLDGRLAARSGVAGVESSDRFLVPRAMGIRALLENGPTSLPEHERATFADPAQLASRAFWLAELIVGLPVAREELAISGTPDDFENEKARFAEHPHLAAYWLWRHAVLRDDVRYAETRALAAPLAANAPLVDYTLKVVPAWIATPYEHLRPKQKEVLGRIRVESRRLQHLGLPSLPGDASVDVELGIAASLRDDVGDTKALVAKLPTLAEGPEKTEAYRAFFEAYPRRRIAWGAASLDAAASWLDEHPDRSFASLLPACLVEGLPAVPLLLAKLDPELAKTTLSSSKDAHIPGLVRLEGPGGAAHARAAQLFAPYAKLSVVKPKDAASIGIGALALAVGGRPEDVERVLPFARGEKLVGAVAKAHADVVLRMLVREGLVRA